MLKYLIIFFLLFNSINSISQTKDIYGNISNEFNVADCFKSKNFTNTFANDSIKKNSVFNAHTLWRTISLENKNNQLLFNSANKCLQIGLFEIIKFGLFEKKLNAFSSDNFNDTKNTHLNNIQLLQIINYSDTIKSLVFDSQGNEKETTLLEKGYLMSKQIKSYLLKENWFVNSYSGKLEKKIIGIAPLILNKKTEKIVPLFWLYFNEWQNLFALFEAKNYISSDSITYKDVFVKNYFVSKISKESNLSNKPINMSFKGKDNFIESELIKEKINNQEADLFHY